MASRSDSSSEEVTITGRTRRSPALQNIPVPDSVSPEVRALIKLVEDLIEGRTSPLVAWMKLDPPTMLKPAPFDFSEAERRMLADASGPQECPVCDKLHRIYGRYRE